MSDVTPPTEPITVRANASTVVMSESTKLIGMAVCAAVADHFMRSETALIAVLAASGAVVTLAWGLWRRLMTWKALKLLATLLPDEIARVGK